MNPHKKIQTIIPEIFKKLTFAIKSKSAWIFRRTRRAVHLDAAARRRSGRRRRSFNIKNPRRFFIIVGGCAACIIIVIVLSVTLTQGAAPSVAHNNPGSDSGTTPSANATATPIPVRASVVMPVYTAVSISEGMQANVIKTLQSRLMELDYMDTDEPGNIFDDTTKTAVEHFQTQYSITVTGIIDSLTYDLLMSEGAQYYVISIGTENTDVEELQQRLYELGYISKVTGYFGTDTESAVMKFQKLNKLAEDGKVGKDTREMLYSGNAAANSYSYGEQSPEIKTYQERLKKLGYLTTDPDGNFGADTKAAVKRFQENNGLIADGYIGPSTKSVLMSDDAEINALTIGAKGDDVTSIQNRLKELGYLNKITGYFGSDTDTAVRSFQHTNGLSADGKVGPNTMKVLTSDNAKKSTGASVTGPNVESFISIAESKLGCRYVRGGKGPNTFDCSGFVYWCLKQIGIKQGYLTSGGWASSTKYTKITSMSDMKRGDIIVYKGHVAIYAGKGIMIDASSSNGKIVKRSCTGSWSRRNFICAFRVF